MELTNSQYGALVDAYVLARVETADHRLAREDVRSVAEAEVAAAAELAADAIREDPQSSTGWSSDLWDTLMMSLAEDGYPSEQIDAIASRAAEIAEVPLPTLP